MKTLAEYDPKTGEIKRIIEYAHQKYDGNRVRFVSPGLGVDITKQLDLGKKVRVEEIEGTY